MSDQQSESTLSQMSITQKHSQEFKELNEALILSLSQIQSSSSTQKSQFSKYSIKKSIQIPSDTESQDDEQWRKYLTASIKKCSKSIQTPEKIKKNQKDMVVVLSKTAQIKNKNGRKYQQICPICLSQFRKNRGSLECQHEFCYDCIQQWCNTSSNCPCCRRPITFILKMQRNQKNTAIQNIQKIAVEKKQLVNYNQYDCYTCYECGSGDNQHVLLICDDCDFYCCHIYCDHLLNNQIPDGDWFCIYCRQRRESRNRRNFNSNSNRNQRTLDRTQQTEKGVASRTRSRESISHLRSNNLSTFRNIRRRRN